MNKVMIIGRLTRDPEMRYTPQGVATASFSMAVDREFKNAQGERETDFIDVVVWRKSAELMVAHTMKGSLVAVEGRLQIRRYEANDGTQRRVAEVVGDHVQFLDYRKRDQEAALAGVPAQGPEDPGDMLPDDLPF